MDSEDKVLDGSEAEAADTSPATEDQQPSTDAPVAPDAEALSSPEASTADPEPLPEEADLAEESPPLSSDEPAEDESVDSESPEPEPEAEEPAAEVEPVDAEPVAVEPEEVAEPAETTSEIEPVDAEPDTVEMEGAAEPEETATEEESPSEDSSPITESMTDEEMFLAAISDDAPDDSLFTPIKRGQIVTGVIANINDNEVLVDVGAKSEGLIAGREMETLDAETRAALHVGDEIEVYILRAEDRQGHPILSIRRAQEAQDWVKAEEYLESKENYQSTISGYNKGGLIVNFGMVRGFLPASQVSQARRRQAAGGTPSERWGDMMGQDIMVKVIEVNRGQNRLILSERAASREVREERRGELIEKLEVGQVLEGTVVRLTDFGAFVDIGGADGLIHLSELAWKHISHPKEVVKVGDKVMVEVINIDPERQRIGLSRKNQLQDPWETLTENYTPDELVQATITKLTKFGAFARLVDQPAIEGLIHISELADRRVGHPKEVVDEGDVVTLRIIRIEPERRRLGLSLKRVDSEEYLDDDWESLYEAATGGEEEMESLYAAASHGDAADSAQDDQPEAESEMLEEPEVEEEAPEAFVEDEAEAVEAEMEEEIPATETEDEAPEAVVEDEAEAVEAEMEEEVPATEAEEEAPEAVVEDEAEAVEAEMEEEIPATEAEAGESEEAAEAEDETEDA